MSRWVTEAIPHKRPQELREKGPFYLAIIENPKTNVWYKKQRLGVNSIDNMMKSVVKNTPLEKSKKRLTSHSARKTVVKKLRAASVERQSIIQVTGHANEKSLNTHSKLVPINHVMHSRSYDFLYIYKCEIHYKEYTNYKHYKTKGRTIRKVMGGMGKKTKKKFMQGKMTENKIHARKNPKKKIQAQDGPHFDNKPELFLSKSVPKCAKWHKGMSRFSKFSRGRIPPDPPMEMGLPPILIQQGKFAERRRRRMPNAEREPKSPKKAKTNRSAIQANGSVPSTPVSLNIAQVSLKKAQVNLFPVSSQYYNGNGFACFGDVVLRSAFAKLPLPILIPSQSLLMFGSPQFKILIYSYWPDRYIDYTNVHYTPVNCYLLFMS